MVTGERGRDNRQIEKEKGGGERERERERERGRERESNVYITNINYTLLALVSPTKFT